MSRASVLDDVLASGTPAHYSWSFPGAPVDVRLSLDMVERLRKDLQRDREPSAKQGLLFGRMVGAATEIDSFALLPEPPSAAAAARHVSGTRALVGYFRTTSDPLLKLNGEDLRLAETVLSNPRQVFLLIQSDPANAPHPPNATFFFWDEGRMCGDFPFLEFPLDGALLAAAERRRIESVPRNTPAAAAESAHEAAPAAAPEPRPRPRRKALKAVAWGLVMLIVFGAAGAAVALKLYPAWFRVAKSSAPLAAAPAPQTVLGLQAERQNGDLKLTWNRQSPAVLGALSGVLSIEEAVARRSLTLDPAQLRSGNILYAPVSDQVQIQLTVFGPQGSASESAIVILPQGLAPEVRTLARKVVPPAPEPVTAVVLQSAPPQPQRKPFSAPAAGLGASAAPSVTIEDPPALSMKPDHPALAPPGVKPAPLPQVKPPALPSPQAEPPVPPVYSPPTVARRVLPPFPDSLRPIMVGSKTKTVTVTVFIDENGNVLKAEPLLAPKERTPELMLASAVNAAKLWKFNPGRIGSRAVPSQMVVRFEFKLEQ